MKKSISLLLAGLMLTGALAGCGSDASTETQQPGAGAAGNEDGGVSGAITVISREDGSGTRGAFIELTGVEEKNEAGEKGRQHHRRRGNREQDRRGAHQRCVQ
ncbi:hypothetical protein [Agathobaculum sp. NTUH-O15-33]|uniref:hypothetical protein n=1 Tax=Agathobaculum sp. NTUH-O15-33 TaxID=3079302 RepID=UPI003FA4B1A8